MTPEQRRALQFGRQSRIARELCCCACGARPPSHPHHVRSRGAGGLDKDVVPLCWLCHRAVHDHGTRFLEERYEVDLEDEAEKLHEALEDA